MQATILAAGMGKRLGELAKDNTKCMVQGNGGKLIARSRFTAAAPALTLPGRFNILIKALSGKRAIDEHDNNALADALAPIANQQA